MRRKTKKLMLGSVAVGGDAPISVQSMLNTKTADKETSLRQIQCLYEAGCDICRLAVPDTEAAEALPYLVQHSPMPLVADIHFDYRLALAAIKAGVGGIRLNPGNIGGAERVRAVAAAAKAAGIPIRIGINGGSAEKDLLERYGLCAEAMVQSALRHIDLLEKEHFYDIKLSLKASSLPLMLEANRRIAGLCAYPLHLGLTEAGLPESGIIKSAAALGILLEEGIGDTIRISLTAEPVQEVYAAKELLNALELRRKPFELIACPTCGRTQIELIELAKAADRALSACEFVRPLKFAVMGCAVNGPGEAKEADFGIACGKEEGILFAKGELIGKFAQERLVDELIAAIRQSGLAR